MAIDRGGSRTNRPVRDTKPFFEKRRRRRCATRNRKAKTDSKWSWRNAVSTHALKLRDPNCLTNIEHANVTETATTSPIGRQDAARRWSVQGQWHRNVCVGFSLSRHVVCRSGRGDDRQRQVTKARYERGGENAGRARNFSSRRTSARSFVRCWDNRVRTASSTNVVRRSRMM